MHYVMAVKLIIKPLDWIAVHELEEGESMLRVDFQSKDDLRVNIY